MSFYTPNGLKVRLNEDSLFPVILPLKITGQYENILMDLELWMKLPNALSIVLSIAAAFITKSWSNIIFFAFLGFFIGLFIQELLYSSLLNIVFPMFLGSWIISLPLTIITDIVIISHGLWKDAIVLAIIVIINLFHYTDFLLLFWAPISLLFTKMLGVGSVERAFIKICNNRARKLDLTLDWELYDRAMKDTEFR